MSQTTIGERLRSAREGLPASLYQASKDTKIRADFLELMEQDNFKFVAPTYVKGHLRSYARWLGLDEQELADHFDQQVGEVVPQAMDTLIRRSDNAGPKPHRPKWVIAAVLAAGGLLVLSLIGVMNPVADVAPPPAAPQNAASAPTSSPSQTEQAAAPEVVAQAPTSQTVKLKISITGDKSWIEVRVDDSTAPAYSDMLFSGQSKTFEGHKISVVVGNTAAVRFTRDGVDLGPIPNATPGKVQTFRFTPETTGFVRG